MRGKYAIIRIATPIIKGWRLLLDFIMMFTIIAKINNKEKEHNSIAKINMRIIIAMAVYLTNLSAWPYNLH